MNEFINGDCMDGMREYPDRFFDLAICDPPYGGVTQGGYMVNKISGGGGKESQRLPFSVMVV